MRGLSVVEESLPFEVCWVEGLPVRLGRFNHDFFTGGRLDVGRRVEDDRGWTAGGRYWLDLPDMVTDCGKRCGSRHVVEENASNLN